MGRPAAHAHHYGGRRVTFLDALLARVFNSRLCDWMDARYDKLTDLGGEDD